MTAFYLKPRFLFSVGGAVVAATGLNLGKVLSPLKPALVGGLKESYMFKDWFIGKVETSKEDLEDIVAEAKHMYEEELLATTRSIEREKQILDKVDEVVKKRSSKSGAKTKKK